MLIRRLVFVLAVLLLQAFIVQPAWCQLQIITTSPLPSGTVGIFYELSLQAAGGNFYQWSVVNGTLPPGMSLTNDPPGFLGGVPNTSGIYNFRVRVTDQVNSDERDFTLEITGGIEITTPSPLPNAIINTPYNLTLTASGESVESSWYLNSGSLPPGLSLDYSGLISGTPTTIGSYTFQVQISDGYLSASKTFELKVTSALQITTPSPLNQATQGSAYFTTLSSAGNIGPVSWNLAGGTLPPGLTFSGAPTISGTATAAGTYNFTVQATDSTTSVTKPFQITVFPPALTIVSTLPSGTVGVAYSANLVASGGVPPYSFIVDSGSFPPGLTLSSAGLVSGVPTTAGTFNFTAKVTDHANNSTSRALSVIVAASSPVLTTTSPLPEGAQGASYSVTFTATGGTTPYSYSAISGNVPPGLSLNAGGTLSGVPTTAGTYVFTVRVTDAAQASHSAGYTVVIRSSSLRFLTTQVPDGVVSSSYSASFTAAGGTQPYSFTVASGNLPPGLSLSSAGNLTGVPATVGSYSFGVRVTDASPSTSTASFTLVIRPVLEIITSSLPEASVQTPYTATITGQGGVPPYQWAVQASLPPGLSFNPATATLSGTPTALGTYLIAFSLTDSTPRTVQRTLSLTVTGIVRILTSALPTMTVGQPYRLEFAAEGGTPPYTWQVKEGRLPQGLQLTSAGVLEGTPVTELQNALTIQATDQHGNSTVRTYTVTAFPSPLSVSTPSLPAATQGRPYSFTLQANGGTPPYRWEIAGGSLPPGISLSADGVFSGSPTATGTYDFEIQLTDSSAFPSGTIVAAKLSDRRAARSNFPFRLVVNAPPLEITTTSPLPQGAVTAPYTTQLAATGGRTPYFWAVTSGALPPGLILNESSGELAGIPTAPGTFTFTVQARDNVGPAATRQFTLDIQEEADLVLSSYNVTFRVPLGRTSVTPQTVSVISRRGLSVDYRVAAVQPTPWLTVSSAAQSTTPSRFFLEVHPAGLAAGTYRSELRVSSTSTQQVIAMVVNLSVEATGVILEAAPNFSSGTETVEVRNLGGGTATFTTSVLQGAEWLTVRPLSGTIEPDGSAPIVTSVNSESLAPEFYRGLVRVTSGDTSTDIPVLFDNTAKSLRYTLVPGGDRVTARQANGAARPVRSFLIRNDGSLPVVWSATVEAGGSWLSLSQNSGSVSPGASAPVEYGVNAAGLDVGNYYGRIRITASGGPPQDFVLVLRVLPATNSPEPEVAPNSLLFIATEGGSAPAAQSVQLYTSSTTPVNFQASGYTSDQSGWLTFEPRIGTVSTASPASVRVSPVITNLKRGVYEGRIHFALGTTVVRDIPVFLIVTPSAPRAASSDRALDGCNPARLVALHSGIPGNFAASAGWAIPVAVRLYDDCGERVTNGRVVLRFSNGDPALPLRLTDAATASYAGTWVPGRPAAQITITAEASASPLPDATVELVGSVENNRVPSIERTGVLHQFNPQPGGPLAPGNVIQILGSDLAATTTLAEAPLPTTLNGVTIIVAGAPIPISFVSPTQVNAQLPFGLSPGTPYQVIIGAGNAIVPPTTITINGVEPGISTNTDGSAVALHENGDIITANSPALPGEVISIYLAGLGKTDPDVPAGTASPADPIAVVMTPVNASLDDRPINVVAAALSPGLVGLYQVRIAIPADQAAGRYQLIITQNDREANRSTLPVGSR